MLLLKNYLGSIYRIIRNSAFYINNRRFIHAFFQENGYLQIESFNLGKWHHDLYLFTAMDMDGCSVFIKLTNLPIILKNENRAYKKLQKNSYLKIIGNSSPLLFQLLIILTI